MSADFSRSNPNDMSSSGEENAVRSSCAPECFAMALPVSFCTYTVHHKQEQQYIFNITSSQHIREHSKNAPSIQGNSLVAISLQTPFLSPHTRHFDQARDGLDLCNQTGIRALSPGSYIV